MNYRIIEEKDNLILAQILRDNLKAHNLDIPGTVYFDEAVNHLSDYYLAKPNKRTYYVVLDDNDTVIGGQLLHNGVEVAVNKLKAKKIYLEAQEYAIGYYGKEGFEVVSEPFMEDGILHVKMVKNLQ